MDPEGAGEALAELEASQRQWREALIRLLICTGYSDGFIQPPERRLIEHFLGSSGLAKSRQAALRRDMQTKVPLAEVEIPEMPWLVRRYCLEIVLMTALVDREITDDEQAFVEKMVEKLDLWREEMQQSQAALELFLLQNTGKLHYLKSHSRFMGVRDRIQERATTAVRRNLDNLVNEIKETHELYTLLMKGAKQPLSTEEKKKVRDQLTDIIKTIPALAVFALPGGGIILPVLIRLLPFNVLPSSFED
jgi:hypothetical protein